MNPWTLPSAIAACSTLAMLVYTLRRPPPAHLRVPLMGMMAACFLFAFGDWLSMLTTDREAYLQASLILYAGVIFVMPLWWIVSVRFAESQGYPLPLGQRPWAYAPLLIAFPIFFAMLTNPWHGQFISFHVDSRNDYHWVWYVHAWFAYGLAAAIITGFARMSSRVPRGQLRVRYWTMCAIAAAAFLANMIYLASPAELPLDPTAASTGITGILFLAVIYGSPLFAFSPFAVTAVMRHAESGILVTDDQDRLLYANPAAERLLGSGPFRIDAQVHPLLTRRLLLPEPDSATGDPFLDEAGLRALLDDPEQPEGGQLFRLVGPAEHWVRVRVSDIESRRGAVVGSSITIQEVTELHLANQAQRRSEETLRLVLDLVPYHVYAKNAEGQYIFVNRAMADAAGSTTEAMLGRTLTEWRLGRESVVAFDGLDRQVFEQGKRVFVPEQRVRNARGEEQVYQVTKIPVDLPSVEGPAMLGVAIDITEIKEAERALTKSQKLESLGVMAGGIAHDFNNLLVAVLGNASLALHELPPDSSVRPQLEDIERGAQRAAELTRQLLAYAGEGRVAMEDVDLSRLVRDVTDLLTVSIPSSIGIDYDLAPGLPIVHADASQLRQVVMNLVINARDAIGETSGRIRIATSSIDVDEDFDVPVSEPLGPGPHVALSVTDDGVGMDGRTLDRIFDPFFTTKFVGRGLGLAAVRGIVHGHRGALRVESAPGEGACFTIYLPGSQTAAASALPPKEPKRADPIEATVLLVEDDDSVRSTAKLILEFGGLSVICAVDGLDALRVFDQHRHEIDIVLLDLTMPNMGGLEAGAALRERDPGLPIVLSSGYPEDAETFDLGGTGREAFIQKPYANEDLLDMIRETLEESRSAMLGRGENRD